MGVAVCSELTEGRYFLEKVGKNFWVSEGNGGFLDWGYAIRAGILMNEIIKKMIK